MKTHVAFGAFCVAILLLAGGCGDSAQSDKLPPMQINGVNVDISQLTTEFSKASPELQSGVNKGVTEVRYKRYLQGMMELDAVLNKPGLTDKQKKLLTQVIGQLKEVVAKENK